MASGFVAGATLPRNARDRCARAGAFAECTAELPNSSHMERSAPVSRSLHRGQGSHASLPVIRRVDPLSDGVSSAAALCPYLDCLRQLTNSTLSAPADFAAQFDSL